MAAGDADIFLGNWMPSIEPIANKFFDEGTVEQLAVNLNGAKYTLAVPSYLAEQGLNSFGDIAESELVPSGEAGMLAEVKARVPNEEAIVFLGWEPHPMNANLERFFNNLRFTLAMENEIMKAISESAEPRTAAKNWLQENPDILTKWLDGVTTYSGEPYVVNSVVSMRC
jgi:glycine betaine/proline transport system substrate-binding protein